MPDSQRRHWHEANRLSWNAATDEHNRQKRDQAAFFNQGGSTLFPDELELLGDVGGLKVAHLLCNAGQDSLSLARFGAIVTGIDISDVAIDFAKDLSAQTDIAAEFGRADVYDWLRATAESARRFDIAFCSYGAVCWLSDLHGFISGVASILAPSGRFVCIDFHPYACSLDDLLRPIFPYGGTRGPHKSERGVGNYVADSGDALTPSGRVEGAPVFENPHPAYEFNWSISEILNAIYHAPLELQSFREYPYGNGWKIFPQMQALPLQRWMLPSESPAVPLMFSVVAQKHDEVCR